jgi:hypothetical protein
MNKKQLLEKYNRIIPIVITGVIFAMYHFFMSVDSFDDAWFRDFYSNAPILELMQERYQTWTSRTLIELMMAVTNTYPIFWKIADTAILIAIVIMLQKLLDTKGKETWWCCFLILIYPFRDMSGAGWIATTMNYIWPLFGGLYVATIIKKSITGRPVTWFEYLLSIPAMLYAYNQEQIAAVMLVILGYLLFLQIKKGCYKNIYLYIALILNIGSLYYIMTCPGNELRYLREVEVYSPGHPKLTLIEKLCSGLLNIFRVFVARPNPLFLVVAIVLAALVYVKTKNVLKTLISALPLGLIFAHSILIMALPRFETIFTAPPNTFEMDFMQKHIFLNIFELMLVIGGMIYAIYQLAGEQIWDDFIYLLIIVGVGFAVSVVVGLSASMYVSGNRVFMCLYFSLIYVCMYCVTKNRDKTLFSNELGVIMQVAAVCWLLANIADNLSVCISI